MEGELSESEVARIKVEKELQRAREQLRAEREAWSQEIDSLGQVCIQ